MINEAQECLGGAGYVEKKAFCPGGTEKRRSTSIWKAQATFNAWMLLRPYPKSQAVLEVLSNRKLGNGHGRVPPEKFHIEQIQGGLSQTDEIQYRAAN